MVDQSKISISCKNVKLGKIPSFSLTPGYTCSELAQKTCFKDGCYARGMCELWKYTAGAYARNTRLIIDDLEGTFNQIDNFLIKKNPRLFRIHIGGDFYHLTYFTGWLNLIMKHPDTRFLAFTKQYQWANIAHSFGFIPMNLRLRLSAWVGVDMPKTKLPIAWMQDGTETRIPADAIECHGNCTKCQACWFETRDVWFPKHGKGIRGKKHD